MSKIPGVKDNGSDWEANSLVKLMTIFSLVLIGAVIMSASLLISGYREKIFSLEKEVQMLEQSLISAENSQKSEG